MDAESQPAGRLTRIPALDGLRALLAWWVVLYHARGPTFSAAFEIERGPLAWISQGPMAVDVFMIVSGFVIFFLLDRDREGWRVFLVRRFLRLYPVYAVCFAAMVLLQGVYVRNLHANAAHLEPALLASMLFDAEQPLRNLPAQIAVHAVMGHGLVPDSVLHNAAGAFLTPAWSISLEWQFYLVAPIAFALLRRGSAGVAVALALTALAFATRGAWPAFSQPAFLPLKLPFFAIGIASYYAWRRATRTGEPAHWLGRMPLVVLAAVALLVAVQVARLGLARGTTPGAWFPLAIWALVFAALLARGAEPVGRAVGRLLEHRALRRLGDLSYGTYLVHWPVLTSSQALARTLLGDVAPGQLLAWHVAVSFPLVALASVALHRFVERPGIALGRRLGRRLAERA